MLRFLIPAILLSTTMAAIDHHSPSAATPAQLRFAEENKYDSTGPGAKQQEFAYNTYKTLDEALVGYIDDPDTKLPEHERAKALDLLYNSKPYSDYGFSPNSPFRSRNELYEPKASYSVFDSRFEPRPKVGSAFKWQRLQAAKASPLNIAHYLREPAVAEYRPKTQFSFFNGLNDRKRADSSAQESRRQDGMLYGYHSYQAPDGSQHTVQYRAHEPAGHTTVNNGR